MKERMYYPGETKVYRLIERTYTNGDIEYYIQWRYKWLNMWFGKRTHQNHFHDFNLADKTALEYSTMNILENHTYTYKDSIYVIDISDLLRYFKTDLKNGDSIIMVNGDTIAN